MFCFITKKHVRIWWPFSKRRYGEIVREKKSHNGFEAPNELKLVCHLAFKNVLFSFFLFHRISMNLFILGFTVFVDVVVDVGCYLHYEYYRSNSWLRRNFGRSLFWKSFLPADEVKVTYILNRPISTRTATCQNIKQLIRSDIWAVDVFMLTQQIYFLSLKILAMTEMLSNDNQCVEFSFFSVLLRLFQSEHFFFCHHCCKSLKYLRVKMPKKDNPIH